MAMLISFGCNHGDLVYECHATFLPFGFPIQFALFCQECHGDRRGDWLSIEDACRISRSFKKKDMYPKQFCDFSRQFPKLKRHFRSSESSQTLELHGFSMFLSFAGMSFNCQTGQAEARDFRSNELRPHVMRSASVWGSGGMDRPWKTIDLWWPNICSVNGN